MLKSRNSDVNLKLLHNEETPLCLSLASFWIPDLINTSAWLEHAPFAFWLVNVTKPTTLVELGVHQGYSYFTFCQAVQQLSLATRCYAIDTWKGDEHAGFYGEEVFQNINNHNVQKYSGFSRLIRSTFDDALEYFLDNSIDILHIDGRHFYEDIKHDFEMWLPKLSDRGVVLFHDTNVKERHFGVFRLWEEVRKLYPSFEFIHGHGLGVLGVGKLISPDLRALFDAAHNDEQVASIRSTYSRLGAALTDRDLLAQQTMQTTQLTMEQASLRTNLLTISEKNNQQQTEIEVLKNQVEQLQNILNIAEDNNAKLKVDLECKDASIAQLNADLECKDASIAQLKVDLACKNASIAQLKGDLETKGQETEHLTDQLSIIVAELKDKNAYIAHVNHMLTEIYSAKSQRWWLPRRKLW